MSTSSPNIIQLQIDIDNILTDCLNAPKFDFNTLKETTEFPEINPRLIFEAEQIENERIQSELEQQKIIDEIARKKKIEEERKRAMEIAEYERKAKIDNFWGNVSIVLFIGGIILVGLLISLMKG